MEITDEEKNHFLKAKNNGKIENQTHGQFGTKNSLDTTPKSLNFK
jgi:hypothetical protein